MKKQTNSTTKAHLIRGAFYLLLLIAVCAIPLALAQRDAANRSIHNSPSNETVVVDPAAAPSSGETVTHAAVAAIPAVSSGAIAVPAIRVPPYPRRPQVVLYDQYNSASTIASLSSTFTDFPTFSSDLADDFVVPAGQTWDVQSVDADGVYFNGAGPANSFNVFFYADNAGLPGSQVYSALNQPFLVVGTTFTVNLPTAAMLTGGTYWVEVQANMTFDPNGEWGWTDRTVQSNQGAAWQNPGGGFNLCPTWTRKLTCIPNAGGPDQVFRINGTLGSVTPTPTPSGSPTATATASVTPTATASVTPTATATASVTPTATATASVTPTATATASVTPTATATASVTPTATASVTPTATATATASVTPTATATATVSATVTPTATPSGGCVRGFGFWKNHPDQWPVTELQLGNVTYTQEQLLAIMHEPPRGNGLLILAHHLIATLLNIANGADPTCIQQTVDEANALIGDLVIPPIGDGYLRPRDVGGLAGQLGRFNGGGMCAPACEGHPQTTATPTPHARPIPRERPRP
jgi:hypothetical protein